MPTNVIMPQFGESIVEGTITKWLVAEGEPVQKYAPLLEVATDKIDTEVPSPADGILLKIFAAEGQTVSVGTVIAVIGAAGETLPDETSEHKAPALQETGDRTDPTKSAPPATSPPAGPSRELGFISPVVARLAAEHKIDLSQVTGTGRQGRIRKKDILAYISKRQASVAEVVDQEPPGTGEPGTAQEATPPEAQIVPLSRMRKLIAEHMVSSKRTSPHVTTVFACDMSAIVKDRYAKKDIFAQEGVELTFTPYFIAALATVLRQHPYANSSWSDEGIILHRAIHIGVAVALPEGLLVPVIKNADSLNLLGIARAVNELAHRARSGQLSPDDLQGGTFTLTNHGASGSLFATPIINQPQTGILGVGKIHKEPVVISPGHPLLPDASDAILIRPIAYLSFTFDHRVLDGATADAFMTTVKKALETWSEG